MLLEISIIKQSTAFRCSQQKQTDTQQQFMKRVLKMGCSIWIQTCMISKEAEALVFQFKFVWRVPAMHVGFTLTEMHPDKAEATWENKEGRLSDCLLNPTWQMPNIKEGAQKIKQGGLIHSSFKMFPRAFPLMWVPCRSLNIVALWLFVEHSVFFFLYLCRLSRPWSRTSRRGSRGWPTRWSSSSLSCLWRAEGGPTVSAGPYLPLIVGTSTTNQIWDLCIYSRKKKNSELL